MPEDALAWREGRTRVAIRNVEPEVDGGRFAAKRVLGERVDVRADVYADGHDQVAAVVRYRQGYAETWNEVHLEPEVNDRWLGSFTVDELGHYVFTVQAWVDRFGTWRTDLLKRDRANAVLDIDLHTGAEIVDRYADNAHAADAERLREFAELLRGDDPVDVRVAAGLDDELRALTRRHDPREHAATYPLELRIEVDRERARFSSWYEFFPRSTGDGTEHGTFRTAQAWLPRIAEMGFDVVYLPPIHPIGTTARKGRNNVTEAAADDVGSPWAIGSEDGGHTAVHPDLGTLDDFDDFVAAARDHGLEVALDIAFQCSPDHPWVKEHPEWFRHRPDGSIQYAENPPKRYQDIYPLDFGSSDWQALWRELKRVFEFWIERGVHIFRVDNPHTKAFPFWEWCTGELREAHPDVVFLAEAFTRPKVMYELAKRGFNQGYTYFTWRVHKWEIEEYWTELTTPPVVDFFRPNAWPNTPDILPEHLQYGGRSAYVQRLLLAATLCANYGMYGPAFELMASEPREPGSEEYLDSEKYEIKDWDLEAPHSLAEVIGRVNAIRHGHPALQQDRTLTFHPTDNDAIIAYSKRSEDGSDTILCVVNLDANWTQSGWITLDLEALGIDPDQSFQVHDLFGDARFRWHGATNYVELDPHTAPGHIFAVHGHVRTEHDFPYFT